MKARAEAPACLNSWRMENFTLDLREKNVLSFGDRFSPGLQPHFYENNCHYMMLIYTVIIHGGKFRKYGYANFTGQ
jgi:hypothetical protein